MSCSSKPAKKVASKRTRVENESIADVADGAPSQKQVCEDLQTIVKSQISTSNIQTIEVKKPFFEAVVNTINNKQILTESEDSLKPALTEIVNFINSLSSNNCDESSTAQLH